MLVQRASQRRLRCSNTVNQQFSYFARHLCHGPVLSSCPGATLTRQRRLQWRLHRQAYEEHYDTETDNASTTATTTSEWGTAILQQQLPPEHSLQSLLQPLLQPSPTNGECLPADNVPIIQQTSISLATYPLTADAAAAAFSSPAGVSSKQPCAASAAASEQHQQMAYSAADAKPASSSKWVKVVGVCAFAAMLCYLDRTNISTAIVPMAEQFGWDKQFCGAVLSAFFAGYGATQVWGGQLSDKYGGSAILAAGLAVWSLATALTPLAASAGTIPLLAARTLLGMAQGVAFPAMHALLAKQVPNKVRSGAIGIIMACAHCGTALGFGASPAIIDAMGWGWTYYLFGAAALLWLPFWIQLGRQKSQQAVKVAATAIQQLQHTASAASNALIGTAAVSPANVQCVPVSGSSNSGVLFRPGTPVCCSAVATAPDGRQVRDLLPVPTNMSPQPALDAVEQQHLQQQLQQQQQQQLLAMQAATVSIANSISSAGSSSSSKPNVGFWPLMRRKEVWAIAVAQYTAGWGFYGLLAWLPQFFIEHCGLQLSKLGGFTLAPYLLQAAVGASTGILADKLITERKWRVRHVRVLMQGAGMLGPAACLFAAASPASAHSPYLATGLITLAMGMSAMTSSGVSASHLDIAPRHAGVVFGVGNTAGTLAGLVAVPGLGYVLQHTNNWSLAFGLAAVHNVIGAVLWAKWVGDKPLPEDGSDALEPVQQHAAAALRYVDANANMELKLKTA
eukprot:GHRR01001830.1.p1 GENE.GHRR01001830.1~~GHRR01001830.1.p1  ORF type:complete len:736 (+),score=278.53 GHRR01001830.1:328-2535(+)